MSCISIIEDMNRDFLRSTGKEATCLYVGENEMRTMRIEAEKYLGLIQNEKVGEPPSACGLRLYIVDADSHLSLGIDGYTN